MNVEAAAALNCLSSYNEIVGKLKRLWDEQMVVIQNVDDVSVLCVFVGRWVGGCEREYSQLLFSEPLEES